MNRFLGFVFIDVIIALQSYESMSKKMLAFLNQNNNNVSNQIENILRKQF